MTDQDALEAPGVSVNAYAALKAMGHSPAKAVEIVLDAKRGDALATAWATAALRAIAANRS